MRVKPRRGGRKKHKHTRLELASSNGESSLGVADDVSFIQNNPLPVDLKECGFIGPPPGRRSVKLQKGRGEHWFHPYMTLFITSTPLSPTHLHTHCNLSLLPSFLFIRAWKVGTAWYKTSFERRRDRKAGLIRGRGGEHWDLV